MFASKKEIEELEKRLSKIEYNLGLELLRLGMRVERDLEIARTLSAPSVFYKRYKIKDVVSAILDYLKVDIDVIPEAGEKIIIKKKKE